MKRIKDTISRAAEFIRPRAKKMLAVTEIRYLLWSIITVILLESLTSVFVGSSPNVFRHPLAFIFSVSAVYLSLLITMLFPIRIGMFIITECVWLGITIANIVMLTYRVNPLSAADFIIFFDVFSIINVYLSLFQLILICAAISAAIALAVVAMIRLPKEKPRYIKVAIEIAVSIALTIAIGFISLALYSAPMRKNYLPETYKEYGFVYSFCMSWVDRGINRPSDYSEEGVENLLSFIGKPDDYSKEDVSSIIGQTGNMQDGGSSPVSGNVNVIFVQLESFIDPYDVIGLTVSEDPIPNFRRLKKSYTSGQLTVPVAGGGTANTEFEVLSGIPLTVFGLGEYPYDTVLNDTACEAMPYYFAKAGYTTHAIHNHEGTFYNRHVVFENLGFETFTPVEYMSDIKTNDLGWVKDNLLIGEITGAVKSTVGADFVYAITVQTHGKYPAEEGDYGPIKVSGDFSESTLNKTEYFVNQLRETDEFIKDLISAVEEIDENTVIVFFGDHQPNLEFTAENMKSGSIYTTEYVIWSNCLEKSEGTSLPSYRLSSHVMGLLGMEGGLITKLHLGLADSEHYEEYVETLAYDILVGEKYAYGGAFPYKVPDIVYGWNNITPLGAYIKNGAMYATGNGFTEHSTIYIDGKRQDTIYINENLIVCGNVTSAEDVTIAQVAENGTILSEISCAVIAEPD